jgi:hypothetical protein
MWVKFSDRKPEKGIKTITRFPSKATYGEAFESWDKWDPNYLNVLPRVTHWWDGEYNMDLALHAWDPTIQWKTVKPKESSEEI